MELMARRKKKLTKACRMTEAYDSMTHRFAPPLSELFWAYQAAERFRNKRELFQTKKQGLKELKSEEQEALAEYEKKRAILFSPSCNIQDLYEQNQNKMARNFAKLQIETSKLEEETEAYKNVVKGMSALVNVAKIMDEFLQKTMVYKKFVDNAAKGTRQFDSFSDIINKYNSLMSILRKNSKTFYESLGSLDTTRMEILNESAQMEEDTSRLIYRLTKATSELNKETVRTRIVEQKLVDLQSAGFANRINSVRINLYRYNLLDALIASRAVDESIVNKPFDAQIDIICEKFNMLSNIAETLD